MAAAMAPVWKRRDGGCREGPARVAVRFVDELQQIRQLRHWPHLVCAMSLNPPARQTTSLLSCEIFHCPSVCTSSECMTPPAIKKLSGLFALVLLPCHMCIATRLARTVALLPSTKMSCPVKRCCDPSNRAKLFSWL